MTAVVLAVDGNSLVHRSFHAQARTAMASTAAAPAWAVRGLLSQLVAAVERIRPTAVVVGFDDPDRSLRRERWPDYKAHRTDKLDTLVAQLATAAQALRELGVAVLTPEGLEADDVLASAARCARDRGAGTVVVTSDRDAFALIDEHTSVLRIINGGVDASPLMNAERLVLLLGVRPDQYRDFAALRGDPSDNLPGVRGIGPRTAARILREFGSARVAFDDLDAVRTRIGAAIARRLGTPDARASWQRNCQIMTMRDDIDVPAEAGRMPLDAGRVAAVFRTHQLTWTLPAAVRVLADAEPQPDDVPQRVALPTWVDSWGGGGQTRTLPKLPVRKPRAEQLSLFDVSS